MMTSEEREKMEWLCVEIQTEKDPDKFGEYIHELNRFLENVYKFAMSRRETFSQRPTRP